MKSRLISLLAATALLNGCAHMPRGFAGDTDQNVLTGGPVTGTTLDDVPLAVIGALQKKAPHAEVADIDKTIRDGKEVYEISFTEAGKHPTIYISADGQVFPNPNFSP